MLRDCFRSYLDKSTFDEGSVVLKKRSLYYFLDKKIKIKIYFLYNAVHFSCLGVCGGPIRKKFRTNLSETWEDIHYRQWNSKKYFPVLCNFKWKNYDAPASTTDVLRSLSTNTTPVHFFLSFVLSLRITGKTVDG